MSPAAAGISCRQSAQAGKYLTVVLDRETYGIAVLKVREIIRLPKITPLPQMPEYVRGMLNLRGRIIPVIDLRMRFGLPAIFTERTCIVVAQVRSRSDRFVQTGLIVDAVEEVLPLTSEEIEPIPEFGARIDTACLLGMAKAKGQVKTLLDIDRVFAADSEGPSPIPRPDRAQEHPLS